MSRIPGKCLTDALLDVVRLSLYSPYQISKLTSFVLTTLQIARHPSNHWKSSISTIHHAFMSLLKRSTSKHYKKNTNALDLINYNFSLDPMRKWFLQLVHNARKINFADLIVESVNLFIVFHVGYHLAQNRDVPLATVTTFNASPTSITFVISVESAQLWAMMAYTMITTATLEYAKPATHNSLRNLTNQSQNLLLPT